MEKLIMGKEQIEKLKACCRVLKVDEKFEPNCNFGDGVSALENICKYFAADLEDFSDAIDKMYHAVYDKDANALLAAVEQMLKALLEIGEDSANLEQTARNTVAAFADSVETTEFKMLIADQELKAIIDDIFTEDRSLSIGYNNGEYALIIREVVDDNEGEVVFFEVIAQGPDNYYDKVERYVEQFMDGPIEYRE